MQYGFLIPFILFKEFSFLVNFQEMIAIPIVDSTINFQAFSFPLVQENVFAVSFLVLSLQGDCRLPLVTTEEIQKESRVEFQLSFEQEF
jgi:hypothetical protein